MRYALFALALLGGCTVYDPGYYNDAPPPPPPQATPVVVTCGDLDGYSCASTSGCASVYDESGAFWYCTDVNRSCVYYAEDAGCGGGYPLCADGYDYILDDDGCPAGCVDATLCITQD